MNWRYTLLLVIMACSAPSDKKGSEETLNFEAFAGKTGQLAADSSAVRDTSLLDVSKPMAHIVHQLLTDHDTHPLLSPHALDRFGFSNRRKIQLTKRQHSVQPPNGDDDTPATALYYYSFSDTLKTFNAFYNYLDIIAEGTSTHSIKLNQDEDSVQSPPLFVMVYDTVIVAANYSCENQRNNGRFLQDVLLDNYGKAYHYHLVITCEGTLKWQ